MKGQITSGYCWNNVGPGKIPCIINPPNKTAAVGLPGIESVSSGTKDGPTIALFADSAAITPSECPVPNFFFSGENFFAWS